MHFVYECTLHLSTLAMRSTLESRVLHQFEVASLANHLPESAEEAKSLTPSLDRLNNEELQVDKFDDPCIWLILQILCDVWGRGLLIFMALRFINFGNLSFHLP